MSAAVLGEKAQEVLKELFRCKTDGCEKDRLVCHRCQRFGGYCEAHSDQFRRVGVFMLHREYCLPPKCIGCYDKEPMQHPRCGDCDKVFDTNLCNHCNPDYQPGSGKCKDCYQKEVEENTCRECQSYQREPYVCYLCEQHRCQLCGPKTKQQVRVECDPEAPVSVAGASGWITKEICAICAPRDKLLTYDLTAMVQAKYYEVQQKAKIEWARKVLEEADAHMTKSAHKTG